MTESMFVFKPLSNCNELKDFIILRSKDHLFGLVNFQGEFLEFKNYDVPKEGENIPINRDNVFFTLGEVNKATNTFILTLDESSDKSYGVELPSYVRDELISSIKLKYKIADYEALNFLISHIDNIEEAYMHCLSSLIQRNKEFKESFITLLKTYKQ